MCATSDPSNNKRVRNKAPLSAAETDHLRRLAVGNIVRDEHRGGGIDYAVMTALMARGLAETARLPDETGRLRRRCYRITTAGRAALRRNAA